METARCKWDGRIVSIAIIKKYDGYCCPSCYKQAQQKKRLDGRKGIN